MRQIPSGPQSAHPRIDDQMRRLMRQESRIRAVAKMQKPVPEPPNPLTWLQPTEETSGPLSKD